MALLPAPEPAHNLGTIASPEAPKLRFEINREQPPLGVQGSRGDQGAGAFTFGQVAPWNLVAMRLLPWV
jgi:hypothetical protein